MATAGKAVVRQGGKRGVLPGGKAAVFNSDGQCPTCCPYLQWTFTDVGFIDGGQNGAFRSYSDPSLVAASPWSIFNGGLSLRLDFEDDYNCREHNPNQQSASAEYDFFVTEPTTLTIGWSGMGERESANYDMMSVYVSGFGTVATAHAPGGDHGCEGGMGPVVADPPSPVAVNLNPGQHTLYISATTRDNLYHFDAWFRVDLSFA